MLQQGKEFTEKTSSWDDLILLHLIFLSITLGFFFHCEVLFSDILSSRIPIPIAFQKPLLD